MIINVDILPGSDIEIVASNLVRYCFALNQLEYSTFVSNRDFILTANFNDIELKCDKHTKASEIINYYYSECSKIDKGVENYNKEAFAIYKKFFEDVISSSYINTGLIHHLSFEAQEELSKLNKDKK